MPTGGIQNTTVWYSKYHSLVRGLPQLGTWTTTVWYGVYQRLVFGWYMYLVCNLLCIPVVPTRGSRISALDVFVCDREGWARPVQTYENHFMGDTMFFSSLCLLNKDKKCTFRLGK